MTDWTAGTNRHLMGERNDALKAAAVAAAEAEARVEAREEELTEAELLDPTLQCFTGFVTKDSGVRAEFDGGMVRDTNAGKPRFDLLSARGVPYRDQMLTRFAELMARGAEKYGTDNWLKGQGQAELDRAKESALRHMFQWFFGETDEDHAAAVWANVMFAEYFQWKMTNNG